MTPPPPTFTPRLEAVAIVAFVLDAWGIVVEPVCGRSDRDDIVCTVDFPAISGRLLGWSIVFHRDGKKVRPHVHVIPSS